MKVLKWCSFIGTLIPAALFLTPVFAATCVVGYSSGNTHSTLQAAINDTTCSTINAGEKNFYENLVINRELTIVGASANLTDLDGSSSGSVITFENSDPSKYITLTLKNLTIQNGASADNGGGIKESVYVYLILDNVTMKNNSAVQYGGAIYSNNGTITLENGSVLKNNTAGSYGGAIYTNHTINIDSTSIVNNTAGQEGGGLALISSSILYILNSTIGENSAPKVGGIYMETGSLLASYTTIYLNSSTTAGYAGGIYSKISSANLSFLNSVVAKNTGGDCDVRPSVHSYGGNLDSDNTCQLTYSTDKPGRDPGLSAMVLSVYKPASGRSAVVDAADTSANACPSVDEKGNARPIDGNSDGTATCDIGAMEKDQSSRSKSK